jgi:hypothetical protein
MAYWTPAGLSYPNGCGGKKDYTVAQNKTDLSNDVLSKQVTIGFMGYENVIEYLVNFHVAENHTSSTFEFITGYMPSKFSSFWTFNPSTGALATLDHRNTEQGLPIIFSTPDRQYAMGIYSPQVPQPQLPSIGYGRFDFTSQGTVKWNVVYRKAATPAGSYGFRGYVIVGSLAQVQQGMVAIHRYPLLVDARVFNSSWYLQKYPDLAKAFGTNGLRATQHWLHNGMSEGRQGNLQFFSKEYLAMYPDLQRAFGANGYFLATLHYIQNGIGEGRAGRYSLRKEVFDATWYLQHNADLLKAFGLNKEAAIKHWLTFGINEGRQASPNFSAKLYLQKYADVRASVGANNYQGAITHYILYGLKEKRTAR